jgi:hypothetical protein
MNPSRLFRNFVFLFSLVGLGSFVWGERYETVIVKTDDTATMSHAAAVTYLKSNACMSTQVLQIPEGEVAYVFSTGAVTRPGSSAPQYTYQSQLPWVGALSVDIDGLDSNQTLGIPYSNLGATNLSSGNISTNTQPISGPATVRVIIKPRNARQSNYNSGIGYWSHSGANNWDFQASEGYVTFRIVGSEQEPSKKFATVIPENASTNIRVVLEQSTDLINWTTAAPGVFPPSTAKRFFRVRSEEE